MRSRLVGAALGLAAGLAASATAQPAVETLERVAAVVDERLMYGEASRLAQAEVRPGEEDDALSSLRAREPARAGRVSEPDLRRLLRRQLTILKYVEFRFRPQLRITDEQVRKAWEAEEVGRPSGVPLEDAQEALRARLERRALDERVEAWVGELRKRADVRRVAPAAPAVGR